MRFYAGRGYEDVSARELEQEAAKEELKSMIRETLEKHYENTLENLPEDFVYEGEFIKISNQEYELEVRIDPTEEALKAVIFNNTKKFNGAKNSIIRGSLEEFQTFMEQGLEDVLDEEVMNTSTYENVRDEVASNFSGELKVPEEVENKLTKILMEEKLDMIVEVKVVHEKPLSYIDNFKRRTATKGSIGFILTEVPAYGVQEVKTSLIDKGTKENFKESFEIMDKISQFGELFSAIKPIKEAGLDYTKEFNLYHLNTADAEKLSVEEVKSVFDSDKDKLEVKLYPVSESWTNYPAHRIASENLDLTDIAKKANRAYLREILLYHKPINYGDFSSAILEHHFEKSLEISPEIDLEKSINSKPKF